MKITREMTEAFQRGSGYGGDISQPDVERGLEAALAVEPEEHTWQEFNEYGNTCHHPGCRLPIEEHPREQ